MKEWQEEEIYHDGDHFFSDLCHAIDSAQKTIQLETYIFDHDSLGRRILNHLNRATRKGVKVSLLLDGFGCSHWSYLDLVAAGRKGLEARFYHPLPWQSPSHYFWRFLSWRRLLLGLWKLNRRNHRKSCLIDGEIAFLGGMNISERHLKSESGNEAWRDTSLRIKGHLITELEQAFNYAWTYSRRASFRWKKDQRPSSHASLILLNLTWRQRRQAYQDLIQQIKQAKKRIWITNPYFIPERKFIRALISAAKNGIDVQLLVPKQNDVWGLKWAIRAFYWALLQSNIRIFEYTPSILHAKILLIDDWIRVGSSNLNHRSLLHDLEVDVVLTHPESLRSVERRFIQDTSLSKEIDAKIWKSRPWIGKLLERLALLFRRWL